MKTATPDSDRSPRLHAWLAGLRDHDPAIRREAVTALARLGRPDTVPFLSDRLSDDDAEVRRLVARTLGLFIRQHPFVLVPHLIVALRDDDWRVRAEAAAALGGSGSPAAGAPLEAALADPSWQVRKEVALALGRLPAPGALPTLVDWLADENPDVRRAVADAIGVLQGVGVRERGVVPPPR